MSTALTRRAALAGAAGTALTGTTITVARAQGGRAITFVTPFSFILAFVDVLHAAGGGYFQREGLNVTVQQGRGSATAVQQVLGGNALLSRTGGSDHMKAVGGQNAALVAVGTISQGSPFHVISHPDRPIRTPADMKDKTVGILSPAGATENVLDVMLTVAGIDRASVKRQVAPNSPAGMALIERGQIDCYIVSSGVVVALRETGARYLNWNTDDVAPIPGQCYIAARESVARDGDLIVSFLRAVKKSIDDMLTEQDMTKLLDRVAQFEIAEAQNRRLAPAILREELSYWMTAGRDNILRNVPERWQRGYDLMARAGFVPQGDASRLYTNEFVDRALRA